MAFFRVRWTLSRLFNPEFRARLNDQLENPVDFYRAIAANMIPGLFGSSSLRLKDGHLAHVPSFMSLYIFEEIFLNRAYDGDISVTPRTIIDVGANTGLFVLRAKQLWPNAEIVAVEPEPGNYAELQRTIRTNRLLGVTTVNAAIMPEAGEVILYRHPRNVGGHSTVREHSTDTITVPAMTLRSLLDRFPDGTCDLLKIDCEGAEDGILRSLTAREAERVAAIVYEPEGRLYSVDSLNEFLKQLGFSIQRTAGTILASRS